MLTYLLKRLAAMVPTLLGITFLTFLIVNCAPGDPVGATLEGGGADGAGAEGGGQNPERMADAIKAKKKLLGMVTEDYSVQAWDEGLDVDERLGSGVEAWPRAILSHEGMLLAGTADGMVHQVRDGVSWDLDLTGKVQALAAKDHVIAVATSEGELVTLDLNGGELGRIEPLSKGIRALALHGDTLLVGADDGALRVYSFPDLGYQEKLEEHIAGIYDIEVGADRFWTAGYDRVLREWDAETLTVVRRSEAHGQAINDLALSPDGSKLATACDDRKAYVFSLDDLDEPLRVFPDHYKRVTAVAWSEDGSSLYTGGHDELLRRWTLSDLAVFQAPAKLGRVNGLVLHEGVLYSAADGWKEVPVVLRYVRWLGRLARLDFDRSFVDDQPVIDKIAEALPVTILLNVISISLIYLISIPLGVLAAVKRGSTFDHISSIVLFMLYSLPNFWLATLLIMGLSSKQAWDVLPSVGLHANNADQLSYLPWLGDHVLHLVLPVACMTYAGFASLSRYTRTSLLETIQADYVRTARAKGLAETVVVLKHALRNALITIITLIGNLLPRMIGGSVIIEYIFTIDGMGKLGFDAILTRDYPVIMAITTFSALLTLLGILVSDLLYSAVDPRVSVD